MKKYIKPAVEVVALETETTILTASAQKVTLNDIALDENEDWD